MTRITIKAHPRRANVYVGAIEIPTDNTDGHVVVRALGDTRADALAKASLVAERIASDPVMSALMPPQAMAAIAAAKGLASAAKQGAHVLRSFWHTLRGDGKRRLAKALHSEAVKLEQHDAEQVGFLPLALLAVKYGPEALKYIKKYGPRGLAMFKAARKKKKARPAAARAPFHQAATATPEPEAQHDEPEPEPEPDDYEPEPEPMLDQGDDDQGDDGDGDNTDADGAS